MAAKKRQKIPEPIHPGEILREELLFPLGISVHSLAQKLRVPSTRMHEIVHGKRAVTVDTALRLARYFKTTPQFWLNLQTAYDLEVAEHASRPEIERDVRPREEEAELVGAR